MPHHRACGIDVDSRGYVSGGLVLLRGQIQRRPADRGRRAAAVEQILGDSEVADEHPFVGVDQGMERVIGIKTGRAVMANALKQDVVGLDVAVYQAGLVDRLQSFCQRVDQRGQRLFGKGAGKAGRGQPRRQGATVGIVQYKIGPPVIEAPDFVNRYEFRLADPSEQARFVQKSLLDFRVADQRVMQDLERDQAFEFLVPRQHHQRESAARDLAAHLVAAARP